MSAGDERVIAAFPATGKTWLAEHRSGFVDSDSSAFSWAEPGVRHPDWPANYMRHIEKRLLRFGVEAVFVSTHAEVREALVRHGVPFVLVYPQASLRGEYRKRMVERGSPPVLVAKVIDELWDDALAECAAQQGCTHVVLGAGEHLADAMERMSERPSGGR